MKVIEINEKTLISVNFNGRNKLLGLENLQELLQRADAFKFVNFPARPIRPEIPVPSESKKRKEFASLDKILSRIIANKTQNPNSYVDGRDRALVYESLQILNKATNVDTKIERATQVYYQLKKFMTLKLGTDIHLMGKEADIFFEKYKHLKKIRKKGGSCE